MPGRINLTVDQINIWTVTIHYIHNTVEIGATGPCLNGLDRIE